MTDSTTRPDVYISADVETDGPVPGRYSLLSFGLVVVGRYDGRRFDRASADQPSFYRELQPISEEFQPDALAVNRLDRTRLVNEGAEPRDAMIEAAEWVHAVSDGHRPILVAYPVAFDWAFLYWYFEQYVPDGSPFGHASCLDIRTLYQAVAGTVFDRSGKHTMPAFLQPTAPHTHNALDDAIEQGELFTNLMGWALKRRALATRDLDPVDAPSWLASRVTPIA